MECTEQTTVVHHGSLGLHCRCCSDQISYAAGLISTNTVRQGRAETFGGAGAQNIKGAHETRL